MSNADRVRRWRKLHPGHHNAIQKAYGNRVKALVMNKYGGQFCQCCGESNMKFLTIDHIYGGGTKHRQETHGGRDFYIWLKKNGFPPGFQVLCYNCNCGRGKNGGECPHKEVLRELVNE